MQKEPYTSTKRATNSISAKRIPIGNVKSHIYPHKKRRIHPQKEPYTSAKRAPRIRPKSPAYLRTSAKRALYISTNESLCVCVKSHIHPQKAPYASSQRARHICAHLPKEPYISAQRTSCVRVSSPIYTRKKSHIYTCKKSHIYTRKKSPTYQRIRICGCACIEPYTSAKKTLRIRQKSPRNLQKEPCVSVKSHVYTQKESYVNPVYPFEGRCTCAK